MTVSVLTEVMLILSLGVASQWVAWRFRMPAIVVMSVSGLIIGPVLGLINPEKDLGELYLPIISIAVAIILFEASLNLNAKELRGLGKPLMRIVTVGAFIAWILGSLTAHFMAGLSWPVAFVMGGLFIVTGPTVIMPLLRQSKLKPRVAKILKWEGIIVDPIGALLAVFTFEIISFITAESPDGTSLALFFAASIFAGFLGWTFGRGIGWMFESGHIPEFLKSPGIFIAVIMCFTIADVITHETGLLAVTAMGITLANMGINSVQDMRHFKENLSILLISAIYIMLTASLHIGILLEILQPNILLYVLCMIFLVRPLSIFISTLGTDMPLNEKLLVGWIAPRGIVALTVSGYFASILGQAGYEEASIITSLTFGLVFFTVCAHGFSIGGVAKKLHLSLEGRPGVLIDGSTPFTVNFAKTLMKMKTPVIVVDSSWDSLRMARETGIPFYHGDMLSEQTEYQLDTIPYDYLIAATEHHAYNALICTTFLPEYGRTNVFKVSPFKLSKRGSSDTVAKVGGNVLFRENISGDDLNARIADGYVFKQTKLSDKYTFSHYMKDKVEDAIILCAVKPSGKIKFFVEGVKISPEAGDIIVTLGPAKSALRNDGIDGGVDETEE